MRINPRDLGRLALTGLWLSVPMAAAAGSYTLDRSALGSAGGRSGSASYGELGELNAVGRGDRSAAYVGAGGFVGGEPGEPDIVVGALVDGVGAVDFGVVSAGCSCGARVFRIENAGGGDLGGLAITKDGADAGDFTVSVLSGTEVPAGKKSVIFTVVFSPGGSGERTASVHIANNTPGPKGTFDIALKGTGSDSTVRTKPDLIERADTMAVVKVQVGRLLANDTDPGGGPLNITSVGDAQPAGASVVLVGGFVVYTAPGATAGDGSFTYTLCGGPGGKPVTGTVTVREKGTATEVAEDSGPTDRGGKIEVKEADVVLTHIGVPFRSYGLQFTTDTAAPYRWNEFEPPVVLEAPASGVITYTDVAPGGATRFYRFQLKR
jgi:hypothetical protein